MKQLQSTTEGVWVELKKVELTQEERELQMSREESDKEARKALMERIKSEREVEALPEDINEAQVKYDAIKPALKAGDTYQLIACDLTIKGASVTGILNCRVNGKHLQVRV